MEKRLAEIKERRLEIRGMLNSPDKVDTNAIEKELIELEKEEKDLLARKKIADGISEGTIISRGIEKPAGGLPSGVIAREDRGEEDPSNSIAYRRAFQRFVTRGTPIPVELRVDAVTTTSDIGSVIPTTIMNKIIEKMEATGMILPLITNTSYKGGLSIPTSSVKPVATWVSEGSGSDKQKKTTSSIVFSYHKLRCAVAVSIETDTVALPIFEATLITNVATAMVKSLEQAIISGVGTGSPKGILKETPATGQALDAVPSYATMVAAEAALPIEYENNSVWVMTKKTFMAFIGLVDDAGQPIARTNYGLAGKPDRSLLGRPVLICNYLDTYVSGLAAGSIWAFIFNFEDYVLNTNYQITVKRYEDYETDDLVTKAIMLADGKVVDINSLVTLKIAAGA